MQVDSKTEYNDLKSRIEKTQLSISSLEEEKSKLEEQLFNLSLSVIKDKQLFKKLNGIS